MRKPVKFRVMLLLIAIMLAFASTAAYAKPHQASPDPAELQLNTRLIEAIAQGSHDTVPDPGPAPVRGNQGAGGVTIQWASGGLDHTHQYLTARALEILKFDKGATTANRLYQYGSVILQYSDWPDNYEADTFTFAGHFYDPASGRNYLNQTSPTALTRFKDHAAKAKTYFKRDPVNAMRELGKALHYLADIGEPHHSANLTALNSNHSTYENWVDANDQNYIVTSTSLYSYLVPANLSRNYATYCASILTDTAKFSKPYAGQASSSNQVDWDSSASATLKRTQEIMAAFLYNFLRSVGAAN
jgi:phospholipase C